MPEVLNQQLFPLDRVLFPIGKEYGAAGAVVQHNNWVFGANEKRERQHQYGLFLFNHSLTKAAVDEWIEAVQAKGFNMTSVQFAIGTTAGADAAINRTALQGEWVADGALLKCEVCVACDNLTAAVAPLRHSWPGKLLRDSFKAGDGYQGPSTSHP